MKTLNINIFIIATLAIAAQGCVAYAPYGGYGGYGGYGPAYYPPVGVGFAPAWGFRGGWGRGWGHHGRR